MPVIHIMVEPVWLVSVMLLLPLFFHAVIASKQDMKEIKIDLSTVHFQFASSLLHLT
jgi:hypothetical protein